MGWHVQLDFPALLQPHMAGSGLNETGCMSRSAHLHMLNLHMPPVSLKADFAIVSGAECADEAQK